MHPTSWIRNRRLGQGVVDPLNSTQTTTLANLDTLGSLISAFATVANDDWRARFLKAATPPAGQRPDTLEAMAGIARKSGPTPKELYALFDEAYPQPKDGARRRRPSCRIWPAPRRLRAQALLCRRRLYSAGRLMFDAEGNLWSGQTGWPVRSPASFTASAAAS